MYCKYCGTLLDEDAVFCENCGNPVSGRQTPENRGTETSQASPVSVKEETDCSLSGREQGQAEMQVLQRNSEHTQQNMELVQEEAGDVQSQSETPEGEKQNVFVKKKKNTGIMIAAACVILIALAVVFFLPRAAKTSDSVPDVLSQNNFNNGGIFAYDDSRLYFNCEDEENDQEKHLYSTKYDGTDKKILSTDKSISYFRLSNGKLLFSRSDSDSEKYSLAMMNPDGTEEITLVETSTDIKGFDMTGNSVFYLVDHQLHVCSSAGKEDSVILSDVENFVCAGAELFYSTENGVFSYDIAEDESTKLTGGKVSELCFDNRKLYYKKDGAVFELDVKNQEEKKIADVGTGNSMIILDDMIYMVRMLEYEELKALLKKTDMEDYIFEMLGTGFLMRISKETGVVEEMDGIYSGVSLFAYPEDIYGRVSFFSNQMISIKKEIEGFEK